MSDLIHIDSKQASAPRSQETAEVASTDEAQTVVKLLRAIAGGENAKAIRHEIIFGAAANLIENLVAVQGEHENDISSLRSELTGWLAFAEAELSEFDIEDEDDCSGDEPFCPKCRLSGCIQQKIRRTRAILED